MNNPSSVDDLKERRVTMNNVDKFKDFLHHYLGIDDVEEAERLSFIQFLDAFGNFAYDRENLIGHLSSSCWITNHEKNKVLMIYHNIFKSWAWVGGHADKETDLLHVACKETEEETGLINFKPLSPSPIDLNVMTVHNHYKQGKFVPRHLHYNVVYAFEADENDPIHIKPDENSGIKWIDYNEIDKVCDNEYVNVYYHRIIDKIKKIC